MSGRALSLKGQTPIVNTTCSPSDRYSAPNSVKDIRKQPNQCTNLLSPQSASEPITSFFIVDRKVGGMTEDLNSNHQDMVAVLNKGNPLLQTETHPPEETFQQSECISSTEGVCKNEEEIKRTENSLEVSNDNANEVVNVYKVGFDPDGAWSHRVDVLWRVQEGRLPETDASVSNCVMRPEIKPLKLQQTRSRILPQFQPQRPPKLWGYDENGIYSDMDGNENQIPVPVVGKKSEEDDQGDRNRRPGHDGDAIAPQNEEPLARREPLNWPWHSGNYQMHIRFHNSEFRTAFSSKIIFLKALQWALITLWTLSAQLIPKFKDHVEGLLWTVYITTFIFVTAIFSVRSTNLISNSTSYVILTIYTTCLAHLCAILYAYYNSPVIPIVLITLAATYMLAAMTYICMELDADSPVVFYPIFVFAIMTSIVAFWATYALRHENMRNPLAKMTTMWFPCCLLALIICSAEMVEIQALLRGTRTPLQPTDWMLATTFLF